MKKTLAIIGVIIVIVAVVVGAVIFTSNKDEGKETQGKTEEAKKIEKIDLSEIGSAEDLSEVVNKIYENVDEELVPPSVQTQEIDLTDAETVSYLTGLDDGDDLEYLLMSEPMMSSQAYSLMIAKVKEEVNPDEVAERMCEGVDVRKWICVTAEQVYATSAEDIVFLVMTNKETADEVYDVFKALAGDVGEEYSRESEEEELPPDMY